jgi:nucleotide-binding universal stress UspA family protein
MTTCPGGFLSTRGGRWIVTVDQIETVLVPIDGSDEAREAARYAVAVADRYDAGLHGLYVLDERTVQDLETGEIAESDVARVSRDALDAVADAAEADGVPFSGATVSGFSIHRKITHPGSIVLDAADEVDADFLVVPRQPVTVEDTLGKAAEYILAYASQPVLSV